MTTASTGVATLDRGVVSPSSHPGSRSFERAQRRTGALLLAPYLIHVVVFTAIPMVMALALSFTDYGFLSAPAWVGLLNYAQLATDDRFRTATINTVLYSIVAVPIAMAIALTLALGLNQKIRFRNLYRAAFYLPQVTATVAVATIWLWIYNPDVGLANALLGLLGLGRVRWLVDPAWALPALMIVGVWQGLGAKMIIYLAALQGIPREQLEAAKIDGASAWQSFRHVTWPQLGPANFFVLVTSIIASFQIFDQVYVMTKGGPVTSTVVLTYDIYQNAFDRLRLGYASAESVVLLMLIGIVTLISLRWRSSNV
jgi:multiple sugar transport system permease protein